MYSNRAVLPRGWLRDESPRKWAKRVGETVGYQVRFEEVAGPHTRLRFVTEGVLTRRLISDPHLKGVAAVVLDEFHERHLEGDLALALLKRLQGRRPDLRIVVMSATLDADSVARYLDECPIIRSKGKLFELSINHLPYSPEPLEVQVRHALELLIAQKSSGDILAFLPGAAEIHRAMRECEETARRAGLLILPLHGSLSPRRTGPRSRACVKTKTYPGDQCCGKLHYRRRRKRGDRQRPGTTRDLVSMDRIADT